MDAENLAVDDGAEGHEVEDLTTCFPDRCVAVFLHAFFIETINLGDLAGFVVTADEGYAVGVSRLVSGGGRGGEREHLLGFEAEEEGEGFKREVASIYIVAEEYEVTISLLHDIGVVLFAFNV